MMVNRDRALTKIAPRILNAAEKHRIFFAIGALGLVVLTAYALNRLNNADEAPPIAQSTQRHVAIVRAARLVTKGQVLAAEDMEVATITGSPPAGAIVDPGAALGKLALTDIRAAQPISAAMLQPLSGLAPRVPPGYRAISLQTTDEIAVGGQPGVFRPPFRPTATMSPSSARCAGS